jgi:hypothetical protein
LKLPPSLSAPWASVRAWLTLPPRIKTKAEKLGGLMVLVIAVVAVISWAGDVWEAATRPPPKHWTAERQRQLDAAVECSIPHDHKLEELKSVERYKRVGHVDPGPNFKTQRRTVFIGNLQPSLGQEILHIAIAQGEAQVQPDRVLDYWRREAMAAIGEQRHVRTLTDRPIRSSPLP